MPGWYSYQSTDRGSAQFKQIWRSTCVQFWSKMSSHYAMFHGMSYWSSALDIGFVGYHQKFHRLIRKGSFWIRMNLSECIFFSFSSVLRSPWFRSGYRKCRNIDLTVNVECLADVRSSLFFINLLTIIAKISDWVDERKSIQQLEFLMITIT